MPLQQVRADGYLDGVLAYGMSYLEEFAGAEGEVLSATLELPAEQLQAYQNLPEGELVDAVGLTALRRGGLPRVLTVANAGEPPQLLPQGHNTVVTVVPAAHGSQALAGGVLGDLVVFGPTQFRVAVTLGEQPGAPTQITLAEVGSVRKAAGSGSDSSSSSSGSSESADDQMSDMVIDAGDRVGSRVPGLTRQLSHGSGAVFFDWALGLSLRLGEVSVQVVSVVELLDVWSRGPALSLLASPDGSGDRGVRGVLWTGVWSRRWRRWVPRWVSRRVDCPG